MSFVRTAYLSACALVTAAALSACSSGESEPELHNGVEYAEAQGFEWPLTVERVSFKCPGGNELVIVTEDGTEYAGNGLAKGAGYADIDPIWRDDPEFAGLKVGIGELIEWGNTTCGY
jgi:hypothetical protein